MIDGLNLKPGTSSQETDDDEMPPLIAFDDDQTKEQGPEQEQGTTVAERMAAHYREQEEKFESHVKAREKEYKARIEVMDEMKKAFQVQDSTYGDEMAEEAPEAGDKHRLALIKIKAAKNCFKPSEKEAAELLEKVAAELLSSKEEPEAGDKDDSKKPK